MGLVSTVRPYVQIARIDHWFKNGIMLPGIALALLFRPVPVDRSPSSAPFRAGLGRLRPLIS